LIIDEVDWLKPAMLEQFRGITDKEKIGMVLIGMPGLERRLSRYPQLYSRVGHVHQFNPLQTDEVKELLSKQWHLWGLSLQPEDFTDMEAVATMIRLTGGNFRLLNRLCTEIERILQVNRLRLVTKEVVEFASKGLVYGEE
jgi:DNA transposition AAA+ family ATPase